MASAKGTDQVRESALEPVQDGWIDREVAHQFWKEQASAVDPRDPRTVTLDRECPWWVTREVALYQRWMMRHLDARGVRFDSVADLGCGNGDWTAVLSRRASRLLAVDFAEEFVELTRLRLQSAPGEVEVKRADLATFELDRPCDLVVAGAVVQYLGDDDVRALLGRIATSLAPRRGALYIRSTVARGAERRARRSSAFQGMYRSPDWYLTALADAGLVVDVWQLATDFVADEIGRWALGPAWPVLAWPLRLVRRTLHLRRPTDVFACVARPPA
jgi:SAM-dependent methyltransferase